MVLLVHVCTNLFRVLAHACASEVRPMSSMYRNQHKGINQWLCLIFLVHVCADLFRILAHASAWDMKLQYTETN